MCYMLKGCASDQHLGLFLSDPLGSRPALVGKEEGNSFLCHKGAIRPNRLQPAALAGLSQCLPMACLFSAASKKSEKPCQA